MTSPELGPKNEFSVEDGASHPLARPEPRSGRPDTRLVRGRGAPETTRSGTGDPDQQSGDDTRPAKLPGDEVEWGVAPVGARVTAGPSSCA